MAKKKTHQEILESEAEAGSILFVFFVPSKTKDGKDLPAGESQELWADAAGEVLTEQFGGATAMPPAKGMWMNDDGKIIKESVILVHSYASKSKADDAGRMEKLAKFLHRMGKRTNQGEIGVVIEDMFHRIRKFTKG